MLILLATLILINPNILQWPRSKTTWEAIASDFEDKWAVPNCLGAIIAKRIPAEVVPECRWMYLSQTEEPYFLFVQLYNANYHVTSATLGFPGLLDDNANISNTVENPRSDIPPDTTLPGTTRALPYTFIGSDTLPVHARLRAPSRTKDDEEMREIERGLRPAEKACQLLFSRFGCLRGTVPIASFGFGIYLTRAIGSLHNFFMDNNPEYAGDLLDHMADQSLTKEQTPINVSIPRYAIDVDKEWMDKLHMDEETFQCLLQLTMPSLMQYDNLPSRPDVRLRVGLRYIATATGYDAFLNTIFETTFCAIAEGLQEYEGNVSI